nr:MAG TPA: hypothetical protein [Caudoviricetes sp.]DAP53566.1 MAG TPA: hypothetical protein [Caudoviricetes sp.]
MTKTKPPGAETKVKHHAKARCFFNAIKRYNNAKHNAENHIRFGVF